MAVEAVLSSTETKKAQVFRILVLSVNFEFLNPKFRFHGS